MLSYKCVKCGTDMESPDSMGGQEEACPVCGQPNVVRAAQVSTIAGSEQAVRETVSAAPATAPPVPPADSDGFTYFDKALDAQVTFSRIGSFRAAIAERGPSGPARTVVFGKIRIGLIAGLRLGATGKLVLRDESSQKWTFQMEDGGSGFIKWLESPVPITPESVDGEMGEMLRAVAARGIALDRIHLGTEANVPTKEALIAIVLSGDTVVICRQCRQPHPLFPQQIMSFTPSRFRFLEGSGVSGYDLGVRLGSGGKLQGCRVLDDTGKSYAFSTEKKCVTALVSGVSASGSTNAPQSGGKQGNWSPGEQVPRTGTYKCLYCGPNGMLASLLKNVAKKMGIPYMPPPSAMATPPKISLRQGDTFPRCPNCKDDPSGSDTTGWGFESG
ncbi:MAG: zinc ribbon domain-containing protein [Planctomycetes bacterium]|nr:zinc ribbon domain-containing protein [Planctomycetota bacterium]